MTSFLSKFRRSETRSPSRQRLQAAPLPRNLPNVVPDQPCQRLDFWIIQDQDRNALVERIVPYMTGTIQEEQLPETIAEEKPWVGELICSEPVEEDAEQFHETTTAFWKGPDAMVDELRHVTRYWFWILLRHTFRSRLKNGQKKSLIAVNLEDLEDGDFISQLDNKETASLSRRSNLYTDYKDSYKETKNSSSWSHYCSRVKIFCRFVGLRTLSSKLEHILDDLERDLVPIKTNRKLRLNNFLLSCRELMEKLLPESPAGKGNWKPRGNEYAKRWRELFAKEWNRCKVEKPAGHPLLDLVATERYYAVGEKLYGTLSERGVHNRQEHLDKEVDADVLVLVFAILPKVFSMPPCVEVDPRWDADVEKKRWGLV